MHINPWITLLLIDLPAVAALAVFRPAGVGVVLRSPFRRAVIEIGIPVEL